MPACDASISRTEFRTAVGSLPVRAPHVTTTAIAKSVTETAHNIPSAAWALEA